MPRTWIAIGLLGASIYNVGCGGEDPQARAGTRYTGMSDASAAVRLDAQTLLAADDENNVLMVYSAAKAGPELAAFAWYEPLGIDPRDEYSEADIEGGTVLGDYVFWITSHGRNRNGKWRPNRHRLFAMTVTRTSQGIQAKPFGRAYRSLALDLVRLPQSDGLGLTDALGPPGSNDKELAPKDEGLNIEGLTATADGKSLLIGFRNPVPRDRALLVPLLNPIEVVGQQAKPQFGEPILLDLRARYRGEIHALGIRSIEFSPARGVYLIVAGPPDTRDVFALFRWSGQPRDPARLLAASASILRQREFTPEALVVFPERGNIQLLSDDGTQKVKVASRAECVKGEYDDGWCEQKFLLDARRRSFQSLTLKIEID